MAAGDLTGDGRPDLAYTLFGSEEEAYLRTMLSEPDGHTAGDGRTFSPAQLRVAVGDVNGDGQAELAVGNSGTARHRGRVEIFPGRATGPNLDGARQEINQSTSGVPGTGEDNDEFGDSVTLHDVDDDGYADIAIGVPGEDIGRVVDAGRIVTIPGSARGLATGRTTGINQGTPDIPGSVERGDEFGGYVDYRAGTAAGAVGLMVGAPGEDSGEGRTYVLGDDQAWWFKPSHAGIEV
ncbi:MAG: hypothetical protein GEU93_22155 [Propionibacteriales bacterium]|nr:hypothetical protein [Propionibacteriales bacterium]